jgi:hypothetical protein
MQELYLELALFGSFGIVIYVLARAISRVEDQALVGESQTKKLLSRIPIHKFDARFAAFAEKTLRRIRIAILKFDNMIIAALGRVRLTRSKRRSLSDVITPIMPSIEDEEPIDENKITSA